VEVPLLLSNIRINGNCFPEELNFDWKQVFNCNYRGAFGMGVKLGALRYKRLKVFENRVLGRIYVNLRERRW
jgi:hypothetical protein